MPVALDGLHTPIPHVSPTRDAGAGTHRRSHGDPPGRWRDDHTLSGPVPEDWAKGNSTRLDRGPAIHCDVGEVFKSLPGHRRGLTIG